MAMESVYKLSVILNLVDNMSSQITGAQSKVSGATGKMNAAFGSMQKAGAALTGVGTAITGACLATVKSTFETQNALGELSSLGVRDLKAVEAAAKNFSDQWAGTSKSDFITAAYDIKSGIASLTDEGVAQFTELAALTGKATKSTTEEMGSLFATGYGIYKNYYNELSDMEFGEMFSAGIATAVKNYKTSGSQMASAISMLGATATNANVPLDEQLAILGQLQTTMSGSEAATKYRAFLNKAAEAGQKLGLTFTDANNMLLSTPEILKELRSKYGDTIEAIEKQQLKEAFGTDEAVAMIDLLYNNVDSLESGITDLSSSMQKGTAVTKEMAQAINDTPEQKFQVLKQQIHNNVEELGNGLLPAINEAMDKASGFIQKVGEWVSSHQKLVSTIMNIVLRLGVFLTAAGSVLMIVGTLGKAFLSLYTTISTFKKLGGVIGIVRKAMGGLNLAFLSSPVFWVIAAIVALVVIFVVLWNKCEGFRNFWINLFEKIKSVIQAAKDKIQPALQNVGDAFGTLRESIQPIIDAFRRIWEAAQPLINILKQVGEVALAMIGGTLMGLITGLANAFAPAIEAFASFISFVADVISMFVALFTGDFAGALDFASSAVENLKNFFVNGFDAILSFVEGFVDGFLDTFGKILSFFGFDVGDGIGRAKEAFSNGLDKIREVNDRVLTAVSDTVTEKLGNMKAAYEEHGGGVGGLFAAAFEGLKGTATLGLTFIDNLTGGKLTAIKDKFTEKMTGAAQAVKDKMGQAKEAVGQHLSAMKSSYDQAGGGIKGAVAATMTGVKDYFSTTYSALNTLTGGRLENVRATFASKLDSAKNAASTALGSVQGFFSSKLSSAKSTASSALGSVQGFFSSKLNSAKSTASTVLGNIQSAFSSKLNSAKSTVSSVLEGIRSAFQSKMNAAHSAVSNAISRIRSLFNFSWSLPKLKLPHVSISGSFSINPPSVPKFGISWYKEGGILNGAQIFGAMGNTLLGGGEAGAEAVLPLAELWSRMREIVTDIVRGENGESAGDIRSTGADITSALTSKAAESRRGDTGSINVTAAKAEQTDRDAKGDTYITNNVTMNVKMEEMKDWQTLQRILMELNDAQNRDPSPAPA